VRVVPPHILTPPPMPARHPPPIAEGALSPGLPSTHNARASPLLPPPPPPPPPTHACTHTHALRIVDLPRGSTVLDAAFKLDKQIGLKLRLAEVNGVPAGLDEEVRNGDVVSFCGELKTPAGGGGGGGMATHMPSGGLSGPCVSGRQDVINTGHLVGAWLMVRGVVVASCVSSRAQRPAAARVGVARGPLPHHPEQAAGTPLNGPCFQCPDPSIVAHQPVGTSPGSPSTRFPLPTLIHRLKRRLPP
jgi:hypothetical protein